ncbi:MAG: CinA family nicotinamide mononucleotide deamidase-related protein [Miltoncostaeaceae bacterium]
MAAVLVTGDEVLRGRIRDRNGAHLAAWLDDHGVALDRITVMGDDRACIGAAVRAALDDGSALVCLTGGLGPTHDDLTMDAVADALGVPLRLDRTALALVEERSRGIRAHPAAAAAARTKQATLPEGAQVLPPVGTAAGCVVRDRGGGVVVVLPGPPWELATMWEAAVVAPGALRDLLEGALAAPERVVRIHRTPESRIVEMLGRPDAPPLGALRLGICARDVELELTMRGDPARARALTEHLRTGLGEAVYSDDGASVDEIVAGGLAATGQTVSVAESCTGGGLGARLTEGPGASAHFLGGVIAYDNSVKTGVLGVAPKVIEAHGAVSAECAEAMARGVARACGTDWGLSVTGVAGPGGGTPDKPVGLVFIGRAGPGGAVTVEEHRLRGDREMVRRRSVAAALHLLRRGLASS